MEGYSPDMSGIANWMMPASMGLGGLSDLFSIIQNQRQSNRMRSLYSLLQNPAQLAANVNAMYVPLSAEAQKNVARQVQAEMAMRGAADSRYADLASARAFTEIDTQRRNAVMDAYLRALSDSGNYLGPRAPIGGLSGAMQQVMLLKALGHGGSPNQTGISNYDSTPYQPGNDYGNPSMYGTPLPAPNPDKWL